MRALARRVLAGALITAAVAAALPVARAEAVTVAEAKAFFKDLDDHTLDGRGRRVNEIYGVIDPTSAAQLAAAKARVQRDIFTAFGDAANKAITIEILDAHGRAVPAAERLAVETRYAALKTNGTLDRLSRLQLGIITDHFNTAGAIDLGKFQEAVELFANGELRGANAREMDQLHQWFVWKQFAAQAIKRDVSKAEWEKVLKSLEKGLEIYERVYPGGDPAATGKLKLTDSVIARFDAAKQLTIAEKGALRTAIDGLTTAQVLARESDHLKGVTQGVAAPRRQPADVRLARLEIHPVTGGVFVEFEVLVTDDLDAPVDDTRVDLIASDIAPVLGEDAFSLALALAPLGGGLYGAEFVAAGVHIGLSLVAIEHASLRAVSEARLVPTLPTLALVAAAILARGLARRGRGPRQPLGPSARG